MRYHFFLTPFLKVDPQKIPPDQDIEANLVNLMDLCQNFLDAVANSVEQCPRYSISYRSRANQIFSRQFREVCNFLRESVKYKFPEFENIAVGGYVYIIKY
jgi:hypothetical protein